MGQQGVNETKINETTTMNENGNSVNDEKTKRMIEFLNKATIVCSAITDLNGMLLPRELFMNREIYKGLKLTIPDLKSLFSSSYLTALQEPAEKKQKWPLLNLIRQVLRSCNFKLTPKRISDGYTIDGKKKYKRMLEYSVLTDKECRKKCCDDKTYAKTVSLYCAIISSRQSVKDELYVLDICNKTSSKVGINIIKATIEKEKPKTVKKKENYLEDLLLVSNSNLRLFFFLSSVLTFFFRKELCSNAHRLFYLSCPISTLTSSA